MSLTSNNKRTQPLPHIHRYQHTDNTNKPRATVYTLSVGAHTRNHHTVFRDLEGANILVVLVEHGDGHGPGAGPADQLQLRAQLRHGDAFVKPLLAGERCNVRGYGHIHHIPSDDFVSLLA